MNKIDSSKKSFIELVNKSLWSITQDGFNELTARIFSSVEKKDESQKN